MKKVLVLGKIVDAGLEILRAAPDVEYIELPQHAPDLMEHVPDADAIIVRMTAITAD
ncbi:MAG: phosphoglycerate dehydrogenase, partial [Rhodospirillales bacterium]|nr:phosphoglycerate dehydrogenase [Rhodospirillales bacterium]